MAEGAPAAPRTRSPGQKAVSFVTELVVIVVVATVLSFVLKTWVVQSFWIPSGSMRTTLIEDDRVAVSKFTPGVVPLSRGDVVVFEDPGGWYRGTAPAPPTTPLKPLTDVLALVGLLPTDEGTYLIKRVIGLPGDTVSYRDKQLSINGKALPLQEDGAYSYVETGKGASMVQTRRLKEQTPDGREYHVLHEDGKPSVFTPAVADFPGREHCQYDERGFTCKVPAGQYLMLGDNRDNSHDGRYWGFVEDKLLVGKAFMVWMNLGEFGRIGHRIQ